jgi:hypothetical protein
VDEPTLITIKGGRDPGNNLTDVLSHWLRGVYDSEVENSKQRTWGTLVAALQSEVVGEGAMAAKLKEKFIDQGTYHYTCTYFVIERTISYKMQLFYHFSNLLHDGDEGLDFIPWLYTIC